MSFRSAGDREGPMRRIWLALLVAIVGGPLSAPASALFLFPASDFMSGIPSVGFPALNDRPQSDAAREYYYWRYYDTSKRPVMHVGGELMWQRIHWGEMLHCGSLTTF